jgi:ABC-2 type transport system ATP-binding protein
MSTSIEVNKLRKAFGTSQVLRGVSFTVQRGEILAILGPNGAGKSTIINIMSTLLPQDDGQVNIVGHDTQREGDKVRASIGLTGQFAAVDGYLSARENIQLIGRLYHLTNATSKRVDELIARFELQDVADRPARTYSGGMKRRLDLAMSLVADPPVLFLDEPTTGLDPKSRLTLWRMIKDLASSGRTILLTTQYMEEADYLADNIIVIDRGTIIAEGPPGKLKADAGDAKVEMTFKSEKDMMRAAQMFLDTTMNKDNLSVTMPAQYGVDSLHAKVGYLEMSGIAPETAALRHPTLDDVFLSLTGHETPHKPEDKK